MPTFDPDEQYDPNRPNDLGEYKHYRQKVKEDRRNKYLEDKRRKAAGESSGESSYYTDSEEEVAPRRDGVSKQVHIYQVSVLTYLSSTEDVRPA